MVVNLASTGSNARCYIVNGGGQTVPDWLAAKKKGERRRKKTEEGQGIRLIQDFDFPEASNKIKTTRDGQYCLATGTYKPRMKIFDLLELGLKSERVTDSENVDFCILSDDWTKTLHLQADRSLSVHTASSEFYSTRIPTHGRSLAYHFPSCDAVVGASGNQIYRLNLDQGRFLNPLECQSTVSGVNALDINPAHGLLSAGTESEDRGLPGTVEFWDLRMRNRAGVLQLPSAQSLGVAGTSFDGLDHTANPLSVSCLSSRDDGLNMAVGTSTGHTLLYDLRSSTPYTVKDQGYGLPIKSIQWVNSSTASTSLADEAGGLVASVDSKVLKIWGAQSGQNLISINPPSNINDLHVFPDTGLVFLANEASPITGYYIPQLGNAPKWARFLDNMTEELEQDSVETLYDDYKFVDRQELRTLGMEHLIGTNTLKPYMHGFFVDLRLYTKARAIANPFAYAEYRDRLIREKLEKERESRIRTSKTTSLSKKERERLVELQQTIDEAKVNKSLALRIQEREEKEDKAKARKEAKKKARAAAASGEEVPAEVQEDEEDADSEQEEEVKQGGTAEPRSVLTDSRFKTLFTDPEFQVDEDSLEFAMLNPSTAARRQNEPKDRQRIVASDLMDGGEEDEDDVSEDDDDDDVSDGDSDSSGDLGQFDPRTAKGKQRQAPGEVDARTGKRKAPNQMREREALKLARQQKKQERASGATAYRPRLFVDGDAAETASPGSAAASGSQTFGQRAHTALSGKAGRQGRAVPRGSKLSSVPDEGVLRSTPGGGMEYSFVPSTTEAQDAADEKRMMNKQRMEKQAIDTLKNARMGAGLERDDSKSENARMRLELSEAERTGRTGRRREIRSASRNKTRML